MSPSRFLSLRRRLFPFLLFVGVLGLYTLLGAACPIRLISGVPCPACGMTRAYLALLRGDLGGAFFYHPLFFLALPLVMVLFFARHPLFDSKKREVFFCLLLGASFFVCYVYRLFFDPSQSIYA